MNSPRETSAGARHTPIPASPTSDAATLAECRDILAHNSKSFALASKLLPRDARDRVAAVYAYCRRVDDAIDGCPVADQARALSRLEAELAALYRGEAMRGADLRAFQVVAMRCAVPQRYPAELVAGMAMDVQNTRYETLEDLLLYCHRVAGVVGLMMCHVFEVRDDSALRRAAHLGIAMQLTNICRDVAEDCGLGRIYLPRAMLQAAGAAALGDVAGSVPRDAETRAATQRVVAQLLSEAERYYLSADRGIGALPFRAGLAVRAARRLYHAIGSELRKRDCDPWRGRAVVSTGKKVWLVVCSVAEQLLHVPHFLWLRRGLGRRAPRPLGQLSFPEDVLSSTR